MSAYIVDRQHIVYLVQAALSRKFQRGGGPFRWGMKDETKPGQWRSEQLGAGDYDRAAEVGNMLWMENVKSVSARYPGESSGSLPGPASDDFVIHSWDFAALAPAPDPVQVLKSCDCYAYQSCEHDGWEASEAFAFIEHLRKTAISALPGYDEAVWGAPERKMSRAA